MTIEAILERIAVALEKQAKYVGPQGSDVEPAAAPTEEPKKGRGRPVGSTKQKAEEAPAPAPEPVKVEEKPAPAPEPVKVEEKPAPTPAVDLNDEFDEPAPAPEPAKAVTIDEVRTALKDARTRLIQKLGNEAAGKAAAMKILSDFGKGATVLPGSAAAAGDNPGALKPEFFAAVLTAAKAA